MRQSESRQPPLAEKRGLCYNGVMKLILFCDYGLDDAAATYDVLRHGKDYDSLDLVAIGGNVPSDVALRNAEKLLANCTFPLPDVRIVDTTAIAQPNEYLKEIHGDDGMGDLFEEKTLVGVPVLPFEKWYAQIENGYTLLSLGPMTLIKHLLLRAVPEKFIFMGGNIAERPNFHGYEFNHALDRKAFSDCVKMAPHVAITMDTCRHPLLNIQEKGMKGEGTMRDIVRRSRELTFRSGEIGCYIWDDMAVKYFRHPDWFCLDEETDRDGNVLTVARYILGKEYEEIIDE